MEKMLERNCKVIGLKNKALAERLLSGDDPGVEIEATKNGDFTFQFGGRYFHSRYDPWKEARAQASEILAKKLDWAVLFGLGCGYLLRVLVEEKKDKVIVYEPSLMILKGVLSRVDLSEVLSRDNVHISEDIDTVIMMIRDYVDGIDNLLGYQTTPYRQAFPKELLDYLNKTQNAHVTNKTSVATAITSNLMWTQNYFSNIKSFLKYHPVDALKERLKGVPLIIAGAGPSLKKNAHLLREVKGKALIIAAITAYKPLLGYGVVPDFVIAAEKVDLPEYFTYGEDDLKTRLLLGEVSHPDMYAREVKGKFIFFNNYNRLSHEQAPLWGSGYSPASGGSVTTAAFDMGVFFGCDPIVFVGQDMSFGGGRTHAAGGVYVSQNIRIDEKKNEIIIEEDFVKPDMTMGKLEQVFQLLWLKGLDGKPIPSKYDWVTFHQWFENYMTYLRREKIKVRVINATEGGAYIEGMEHTTLRAAIDAHMRTYHPVQDVIAGVESSPRWIDYRGLLSTFERMGVSLRAIQGMAKDILKEARKISKGYENSGLRPEFLPKVEKIRRMEKDLFDKTESVSFIWETLASHTYALKTYLREEQIKDGPEQFKKALQVVITTYSSVDEACKMFLPELKRNMDLIRESRCAGTSGAAV